jgi:cytochrome c-type biogenesis protein
MNISQISFGVAFLAGLASFLSPCVLPLVAIYLAQLVGLRCARCDCQYAGKFSAVLPYSPAPDWRYDSHSLRTASDGNS